MHTFCSQDMCAPDLTPCLTTNVYLPAHMDLFIMETNSENCASQNKHGGNKKNSMQNTTCLSNNLLWTNSYMVWEP